MPEKAKRGAEATSQNNSNRRKKITQEEIVLKHLREHGSITSMTAFRKYDITRLSAKIFNLRKEGYIIPMRYETSKKGKTYGRYFLNEEEPA